MPHIEIEKQVILEEVGHSMSPRRISSGLHADMKRKTFTVRDEQAQEE